MRHIFSFKVMVPIAIAFALVNGLYLYSVSNNILYVGTAIVAFGGSLTSIIHGSFIQIGGAVYRKGAKWLGLLVYALFLTGSIVVFMSTYESTDLDDQDIQKMRYIFSNFIFVFGYGTVGLIWSFFNVKFFGFYRRLGNKKENKKVLPIEN